MAKFTYKIEGRTYGVMGTTTYEGQVAASCSKDAILFALAAEFGTPTGLTPIDQLTVDGWIPRDELEDQMVEVAKDDDFFCLLNDEHEFNVEVSVIEPKARTKKRAI